MTRGFLYEIGTAQELRQYVIQQDRVIIGRGADCDVRLQDTTVSRHHAVITAAGHCRIADLGGANVTKLNGRLIGREPVLLADGDIITVGGSSLRYSSPASEEVATAPTEDVQTAVLQTAVFAGTAGSVLLRAPAGTVDAEAGAEAALSVVLANTDEPALLVRERNRTQVFPLRGPSLSIGRDPRCAICLVDPKASREHAVLEVGHDHVLLRDLGSANGTLVNGVRTRECRLDEDDIIRIGDAELIPRLGRRAQQVDGTPSGSARAHTPVVLVPGLCGTELRRGALLLWPNLLHSISCSEKELSDYWGELTVGRAVRETVVVPGLVKVESFGRLVDFLCQQLGYTEGVDLLEFGYDWRQDGRTNAALLKERVAAWRRKMPDPHKKVVFIAHSMGGLVCRYYLEHLGGLDACARLIQLGTPNRGSTRLFSTAVSGRGALSLPIGASRIRRIMLRFASIYQLMPTDSSIRFEDGKIFAPFSEDDWIPAECRSNLPAAIAFREALARTERSSVPTTCVFGYGQRTLVEMRVRREADGGLKVLNEVFEDAGDDSVIEASAVLDRAEIHPVQQRHGALYSDKDVQRRLRYELLERAR